MRTAEMAALRFSDLQEDDPTDRGPSRTRLSTWQTALLVAAGGGVGAALRLIVSLSMPAVTTPTLVEVPWATLWVNLIGCLGLGALVGALEIRPGRPWMRPLLGTRSEERRVGKEWMSRWAPDAYKEYTGKTDTTDINIA